MYCILFLDRDIERGPKKLVYKSSVECTIISWYLYILTHTSYKKNKSAVETALPKFS
jgi:hypothetical protein